MKFYECAIQRVGDFYVEDRGRTLPYIATKLEAWGFLCQLTSADFGTDSLLWEEWFRLNVRNVEDLELLYLFADEKSREFRESDIYRKLPQNTLEVCELLSRNLESKVHGEFVSRALQIIRKFIKCNVEFDSQVKLGSRDSVLNVIRQLSVRFAEKTIDDYFRNSYQSGIKQLSFEDFSCCYLCSILVRGYSIDLLISDRAQLIACLLDFNDRDFV